MNEYELDAELAAANPIDDQSLAAALPPSVGEAMLREITETGRAAWWQRLVPSVGDGFGPARAGFVGVMTVVAVAVAALSVAFVGGGQQGDDGPGQFAADGDQSEPAVTSSTSPAPAPTDELTTTAASPADPSPSSDAPVPTGPCTGYGASLDEAIAAYDSNCDSPRDDCDPVDDGWVCASDQLGVPDANDNPAPAPPPSSAPISGSACVTIEAEALQIDGAWSRRDDGDASGGRYIVWEGLSTERNNDAPADVVSATFAIDNPGTYRFIWSMRQPSDVASDKADDSWLNFPDAGRFGSIEGGSYGGFVSVFGSGTGSGDFAWAARADYDETTSDIAIEFPTAGQYTMQLAGRSHGHQIDKIVIYHEAIPRADAIVGRCTISSTAPASATGSNPSPDPDAAGAYDPSQDLVSLHYDHAPDRDDGLATVAGKVIVDSLGITPWVVGGAYGTNRNTYQDESEAVMDATWGGSWINAHADWDAAVQVTADRWQDALNSGGDVWIAEGGQSDFSADVVRELRRRDGGLDAGNRIHLVQHSNWNENNTTSSDLNYVKNNLDYIRIEDGNGNNQTANLNQVTPGWENRARASRWAGAWDAAFSYLNPNDRLDFSDAVELLHIVGIDKTEIATTVDFADRFFD